MAGWDASTLLTASKYADPSAIAIAIASVPTMVSAGYRPSIRRPTLKSSQEKRSAPPRR
jgi:hypothetical protein